MNAFFSDIVKIGAASALAVTLGAAPAATPDPEDATTVRIVNFAYTPVALHVRAGDRVTFVNTDDDAHTVTADDTSFDSAGLDTNGSWQHVFARVGTYHYFCALHPYMKGTIDVRPAAPTK